MTKNGADQRRPASRSDRFGGRNKYETELKRNEHETIIKGKTQRKPNESESKNETKRKCIDDRPFLI